MASQNIRLPSNIIRVPHARQSRNYTCGVASMQSLFCYFGDEWREDNLAKELGSGEEWGTGVDNIISFAKKQGYTANMVTDMTKDELRTHIDEGHPVLVAYQAWTDAQPPVNWKDDWEDGHYSLIIGMDDNYVFLMDPSTLGRYTYIPVEEFVDRWHDSDGKDAKKIFIHLGVVIYKPKSAFDPNELVRLN